MERPNASPVMHAGGSTPSPGPSGVAGPSGPPSGVAGPSGPPSGVAGPDDRVDEEILDELFAVMGDGGSEGLVKACDLFLTGVPTRFSDIRAALDDGRFDDVAQGAHSLRGSAGAFGARRLSVLTLDLERLSREGDAAGAGRLLDDMQTEFRIFRAVLVARLGSLSR